MDYKDLVQTREVQRLRGYLDAIQDITLCGDHPALFDILVYETPKGDFQAAEWLKAAYPYDRSETFSIRACSFSYMVEEIEKDVFLSIWPNDDFSGWQGRGFSLPGIGGDLIELFQYADVSILKYNNQISSDAYWTFTFMIYNHRYCVILHGRASN